jgi:uncharacterized metal-binding protein YceD (DUF177 family)
MTRPPDGLPEFPHPLALDRIPAAGLEVTVTATQAQCAALARRLGVPALASLACAFRLRPERGAIVLAELRLRARLTQICVVSLDPFAVRIDEAARLRFVPEGREDPEPDPESDDEIPYAGVCIDLGEAAAEQLALILDPYPHKPGAALPDDAPAAIASPFGVLARLRRPS